MQHRYCFALSFSQQMSDPISVLEVPLLLLPFDLEYFIKCCGNSLLNRQRNNKFVLNLQNVGLIKL